MPIITVNAKCAFEYNLEIEKRLMSETTADLLGLALAKTSMSLAVLSEIAEKAILESEQLESEEEVILESIINHCLTGN